MNKKLLVVISILALAGAIGACALLNRQTALAPDAPQPPAIEQTAPAPETDAGSDIDVGRPLFDSQEKIAWVDPELWSPAFAVAPEDGLTFTDYQRLIQTAFKATDLTSELPAGTITYKDATGTYRTSPKSDFTQGADHYLVIDRLKQDKDGSFVDCHACGGDLSVIRYNGDASHPVISKIWNHVSKSGSFGDSGTVIPVTYTAGGFGFVVAGGSTEQGETTTWISAYTIRGDAISENKSLAKTNPSPAP